MIMGDKNFETGMPPDPKLSAAIEKLTEEMVRAGVVLDIGGLLPSSSGARINASHGKVIVNDGPFTEAKEIIGGYAIVQVRSKEEAVELSRKFMQIHIDVLGDSYKGEMELRQLFDPGDFGPAGSQG
jgi:hypothetical protein